MSDRISKGVVAVSTLLLAFMVLGYAPALHGQAVSIASVTGRVTDSQGAVVAGAQIKMTGVETASIYNAVTNTDGIYTFPSLPIGAYMLESTVPGFQTYAQRGIVLRVNDHVQIDVIVKVGAVAERVEVTANVGLVQTQQNTISQVIDQQRIVDLPLNGRDPTELITISGASVNHSDGTNTGSKSFFSSQSISIAGSAGDATNYLLDGGDNNDSFTNVNMPIPFPDALAEFSVETSTLPARNGLHPGGVVNAVTKSGSNRWHGDVFEFIRNGDVNAINYFATKQDSLKRNQFGGTFGGRIIRDKLFFFGGYQGSYIRQDPSSSTAYVPTAAALAGDFSALDGAGCQSKGVARVINDPTTGLPIPNAQMGVSRFDPVSVALSKYLPQTADPCGKVAWGIPVQSNEGQFIWRVDWLINSKHSLYARHFVDNYTLKALFDPHDILVTSVSGNVERAQTLVLGDTYQLSPNTVNSAHFTLGRRSDDRGPNTSGVNMAKLGATNLYQGTPDFLQIAVNNGGFTIGCGTCALGRFPVTSFQYADDVDILRGKHQIAFGVDYLRTREIQENHYNDDGAYTFSGQYSNDPLLDFLMGKMNTFNQSGQQLNDLRQNVVGLYAQDTYHATRRLVINLGLRWEPFQPEFDHYDRGSTFSRAAFDAGQVSQIYANAPAGTLFAGDPGVDHSFTGRRLANLSPRLGIVYDPTGSGKTTLRVGGAILYDSVGAFIPYRMVAQNPPYGPQVTLTSGPYQFSDPWGNVPGGNPFPLPTPSKNVSFPTANAEVFLPPHIHSPSVKQWNFSVQHRFGDNWVFTASYLGNETSHLWIGNEINPAVYIPGTCGSSACSTTGNTQARRVLSLANPKVGAYYSTMILADDGISANYNGFLTSIEHRFAHNFTLLANYTWSKCLGIAPVNSLGGDVMQDPNNVRGDYGYCTYDVPFLLNTSIVYESRFRGHGAMLSRLLKGWTVAPLVRYGSGLPVNPTTGKDNSLTGSGLDRPNVVAGAQTYTGAAHGLIYQYVNPGLYTANPIGTFGNAAHLSLRTPGSYNVDLAVSRAFNLREGLALHIRGEAFNALNHQRFGAPNTSLSSSTFGRITSAAAPRILQASMKLVF
jgi:Carboxypeptidase regulatory-like domain/TonB dependent receptor